MEEIKFKGTIAKEDEEAREMLKVIWTKVETINERTKNHTIDIRNLRKELQEVKNERKNID